MRVHYRGRMIARRTAALLAATALAAALSACAPTASPTPSPTSTGFASEEEAFAAAEATYRAYVDESNRLLAGEESASPLRFLRGQALSDEEEVQKLLSESGRRLTGKFEIKSFDGESWTSTQVQAFVCLDLSQVKLESADGETPSPENRAPENRLEVRMSGASEPKIISSVLRSESC